LTIIDILFSFKVTTKKKERKINTRETNNSNLIYFVETIKSIQQLINVSILVNAHQEFSTYFLDYDFDQPNIR
jgi:hypothetical protein